MLHCPLNSNTMLPRMLAASHFLSHTFYILKSKRLVYILFPDMLRDRSLKYYLSPIDTGIRTHIYEKIGSTDNFLIMFYNNNRISHIPEFFQHRYKSLRITRMQSYTRLVKNIHRAD